MGCSDLVLPFKQTRRVGETGSGGNVGWSQGCRQEEREGMVGRLERKGEGDSMCGRVGC